MTDPRKPAASGSARKIKPSGLGEAFDFWWAGVAASYRDKRTETVAKAAWVEAWNDGRKFVAPSALAAPPACPVCTSRQRVHDLFERKWNKDEPEVVNVDEIMEAAGENRVIKALAAPPAAQGLYDALDKIWQFANGNGDVCQVIVKIAMEALKTYDAEIAASKPALAAPPHDENMAPHNKFSSFWCDACPRPAAPGEGLAAVLERGLALVESAFAHVSHGGPTRADAEKWIEEARNALQRP